MAAYQRAGFSAVDAAMRKLFILPNSGSKRISEIALATTSGIALRNQLGVPHEASQATIMLKASFQTGLIRSGE